MKRFLCIFAAAALMLVLSSCGMTAYEDADSYFKISFPESMKVFVMSDFSPDDPALEEYGIDADEMSNFKEKEGGIFYAKDSLRKSCSVAINGSDTTIDIWELKKSDSDTVIDLYKQIASSFNGAGYAVIAKTGGRPGRRTLYIHRIFFKGNRHCGYDLYDHPSKTVCSIP